VSKQSVFYQELQGILEKPGCPICHVGRKTARGRLDALLYDSVNDPESRERLARVMGFCSAHSRELLTFPGERLGATIVEQAVLKEALRRLQDIEPAGHSGLRGWLRTGSQPSDVAPLGVAGPCPVCADQADIEQRSLRSLVEHLGNDLEVPLEQAGGLCWPHLELALRTSRDSGVRASLVAVHSRIWQQLIDDMGEFIRKRDYRFSHETITEVETRAVERAIAVLTGEYPAL
jgi:hypothetical protein